MAAPVMSTQFPLSLPGLYDTTARRSGVPLLPLTRGDCEGGIEEREAGGECPHLLCRYHLLGELARRPDAEAVPAVIARLEGHWTGCCALDVAERGGLGEQELATMLGIPRERAAQLTYEAGSRLRAAIERE